MNEKKRVEIKVQADLPVQEGAYSNFAKIGHTADEVTIDFLYINFDPPFGRLRSRIILSPGHAKRLLAALNDNLQRYESSFGPIVTPVQPPPDLGLVQ
ncbi:MAG TPA: DUF3467 domain-containing protein [Acidobacteriota bacterium]